MIQKLHHSAYRCRDSEQTRRFYEDFLGLPLANAFAFKNESKTGGHVDVLHSFYRMADGSHIAFFEAPAMPFEFKQQHDFDLHIAVEVEDRVLAVMLEKARALGIEARGISDHGRIHSIYLRDPNGYVIELCARQVKPVIDVTAQTARARETLRLWTAGQATSTTSGPSRSHTTHPPPRTRHDD